MLSDEDAYYYRITHPDIPEIDLEGCVFETADVEEAMARSSAALIGFYSTAPSCDHDKCLALWIKSRPIIVSNDVAFSTTGAMASNMLAFAIMGEERARALSTKARAMGLMNDAPDGHSFIGRPDPLKELEAPIPASYDPVEEAVRYLQIDL